MNPAITSHYYFHNATTNPPLNKPKQLQWVDFIEPPPFFDEPSRCARNGASRQQRCKLLYKRIISHTGIGFFGSVRSPVLCNMPGGSLTVFQGADAANDDEGWGVRVGDREQTG